MYYVGIDIGGMSLKGGVITEKGEVLAKDVVYTQPKADEDIIIADLFKLVNNVINKANLAVSNISGIGIGIPGTVNTPEGRVRFAPNINFVNTPIVEKLGSFFNYKIPIKISNDANCAALGEALFGGMKNVTDAVMVTLGTGIGTGFMINGALFEGVAGGGAEGGHMIIKMGGIKDGSGTKGTYEAYASVSALIRQTKEATEKHPQSLLAKLAADEGEINGKTVFSAEQKGCPVAAKVIKKYLEYVGVGLVNMVNIFRPQIIIIGGAISKEGDKIIKPLQRYINRYSYAPKLSPKVKIVRATLTNDAGIMGAAALLFRN